MNALNKFLELFNNKNNDINIVKTILQSGSPKQAVMKYINNVSPQMQNIIHLANSGKTEELKAIARDIFQKEGRDFDKEFESFYSQLK